MSRSMIVSAFLVVLLLVACGGAQTPKATMAVVGKPVDVAGGSYTDVSVGELQYMLADKDFSLVNVHIPFDGNIAKTELSIAYDQVAQNLDKLPGKDAKIVLYCRSGRMSAIAAETLVGLGYTNIFNLQSGMAAWEQAGNKIER